MTQLPHATTQLTDDLQNWLQGAARWWLHDSDTIGFAVLVVAALVVLYLEHRRRR